MNRRKAVRAMAGAAAVAAVRPLKAASRSSEIYLKRWNTAKEFTLKVLDAMPAENFDFKPHPAQMSFGKLMTHLSSANTRYFARIKGGDPPMNEPENADKATARKFMEATFDWCAEVLAGMTEEDMAKMYPGRGTQQPVSGRDLVLNGFIHTAHHRGYSEVYMRVKGLEPPRYGV